MAGRCSQMKQNLEQLTISIDLPGKSFQESWNILSLIPLTVDVSPLHANLNCSTAHFFSAPPIRQPSATFNSTASHIFLTMITCLAYPRNVETLGQKTRLDATRNILLSPHLHVLSAESSDPSPCKV